MNKELILLDMKRKFKTQITNDYIANPDAVLNSKPSEVADEILKNSQVRLIFRSKGIKKEDLVDVLTKAKEEVIKEANTPLEESTGTEVVVESEKKEHKAGFLERIVKKLS
jgi:hypothetical protein